MQNDRNASLVHPACPGGRRRERTPEDMVTHTHARALTLTLTLSKCETSSADLLVDLTTCPQGV